MSPFLVFHKNKSKFCPNHINENYDIIENRDSHDSAVKVGPVDELRCDAPNKKDNVLIHARLSNLFLDSLDLVGHSGV